VGGRPCGSGAARRLRAIRLRHRRARRRALVSPAFQRVHKEPFRLSAWFGPHNPGREPGAPGAKHTDYTARELHEGGTAIAYWQEDPYLRQEYAETLKANGVLNRMEPKWFEKPANVQWSPQKRMPLVSE
jgi:hypothetical protein